jgi:SAM-dependent methyltransferase
MTDRSLLDRRRRDPRRAARRGPTAMAAGVLPLVLVVLAAGRVRGGEPPPCPTLRTSDVLALAERFSRFSDALPDATELKKAVEDGTIRPGRAVVLGCGLGTNAIDLAGKGFDVTAIDVAPTALSRAEARARKAGVRVRWLVADVLAPPKLEPFDFLFDRGCYHHVRGINAAAFVEMARRLSHAGSRLLILAGSARGPRRGGPPRIKESEIRGDFSESFDFQHLREIRFDSRDLNRKGAPAWSVLLRRKDEKRTVK